MMLHTPYPNAVTVHYIGVSPLPSFPHVDFVPISSVDAAHNLSWFMNPTVDPQRGDLNKVANYARFVLDEV